MIVQFLDLAGKAKDAGELAGQLEALLAAYEFDFYVFSLHPVTRGETGNSILAARWPRG